MCFGVVQREGWLETNTRQNTSASRMRDKQTCYSVNARTDFGAAAGSRRSQQQYGGFADDFFRPDGNARLIGVCITIRSKPGDALLRHIERAAQPLFEVASIPLRERLATADHSAA
jgi:hypothetical protein